MPGRSLVLLKVKIKLYKNGCTSVNDHFARCKMEMNVLPIEDVNRYAVILQEYGVLFESGACYTA